MAMRTRGETATQVLLLPAACLPQELLHTCMSVAVRGTGVPHWVAVHDVEGLTAGIYRWPGLRAPARPGTLRGELHQVLHVIILCRNERGRPRRWWRR